MSKEKQDLNLEFYKEQYLFEYERGKAFDKPIQFVTTLIVVFIGAAAYSYKEYFEDGIIQINTDLDKLFLLLLILFSSSIIFTIYFVSIIFYGFTREYHFLPSTGNLFKHEMELYKHYYKYEKGTYEDKRNKAKKLACSDFQKNLKKYYVEMTEINQNINDKRADNYFLTRTFLFVDLILLILLGTIGFLFSN